MSIERAGCLNPFRKHMIFPIILLATLLFNAPSVPAVGALDAKIIEVNDGDTVTLLIEGKRYRSRLIGIDAPESGQEPWGALAKDYLRKLLKKSGGKVTVEQDIVGFDKYERLLVYIWSGKKELVNEVMLRQGYAVLFTIQPNSRYVDRFRKAQRLARDKKRGVWGPDGLKERPIDYKKKHPRR